jgi:hypothetical protein
MRPKQCAPLEEFFPERYDASFSIALNEFHCATEGRDPSGIGTSWMAANVSAIAFGLRSVAQNWICDKKNGMVDETHRVMDRSAWFLRGVSATPPASVGGFI